MNKYTIKTNNLITTISQLEILSLMLLQQHTNELVDSKIKELVDYFVEAKSLVIDNKPRTEKFTHENFKNKAYLLQELINLKLHIMDIDNSPVSYNGLVEYYIYDVAQSLEALA